MLRAILSFGFVAALVFAAAHGQQLPQPPRPPAPRAAEDKPVIQEPGRARSAAAESEPARAPAENQRVDRAQTSEQDSPRRGSEADGDERREPGRTETRKPSAEQEGVERTIREYAEAFNKKDVKALAALWAPEGVYTNRETGERIAGRESIEQEFSDVLTDRDEKRLSIGLNDVRLVKPDVAIADGRATVSIAGEAGPSETAFSAVFVKQEDRWLLDSVHEAQAPTPPTPRAALAELEWLVGAWVDDSDDAMVTTSVRWSPNEAFLIRSFRVQLQEDDELREGTQVIGWDPRNKQIRSWTFDSDGSFGEGTWSKNREDWLVRMSHTLADGRVASGTQVISRVDNDSVTVQSIGSEVEGEPTPTAEPVRVIRVREQAAQN